MKHIVASFIVALGLTALGLFVYCGFRAFADKDRQIVVRGLAEMEVEANKVTWPIVIKTVGNDLPTLYDNATRTARTVREYLHNNSITDQEISNSAPTLWDKDAQTYRTDAPYRYNLTQVITVTSSQIGVVNKLIEQQADLIKLGVAISSDYQYQTTYEYTQLNDVKPRMIAEATDNARMAAQKFADDSGSSLGNIKYATQGQFSISDRDAYTPWIKNVRVVTTVAYDIKD